MTHILDTSAWLAHVFKEPGYETVSTLMLDPEARVGISAVSLVEAHSRMKAVGAAHRFPEIIAYYEQLFADILPVDEEVSMRAITLRSSATGRIPVMDALIAATAATQNAILVHRDPHFGAIPNEQVRQVVVVGPE